MSSHDARVSTLGPRWRVVWTVLSLSVATCGGGFEVRPPCSALERADCWQIPRNEALHCDADARVADALTQLGSFEHQAACASRVHMLLGPGTEEPTEEEHKLFVTEHLRFAQAMDGVRFTSPVCCAPVATAGGCLTLYVDRCSGPALDAVAKQATRWAKGLDMGHKRFRVIVNIGGHEARCDASDPTCAPLPYDKAEYEPGVAREIIRQSHEPPIERMPTRDSPCEHDGDCGPVCHDCQSRVEPIGDVCSQEYRGQLEHALCGCIGGHCSWFSQ